VQTEYAFAEKAASGARGAFLEYLADDSVILQPGPLAGRPFWSARPESANEGRLAWYPSIAEISSGADLGFTTGPWTYTAGAAAVEHGHFVSVWRRDSACAWHVEFDGGVSHAEALSAEAKWAAPDRIVQAAPGRATVVQSIDEFRIVARVDGLKAALRTYSLNSGLRFYMDGQEPMDGPVPVLRYLSSHIIAGNWQEYTQRSSVDSTLTYSVGEILNEQGVGSHAYIQVWVYDAKVANWGLRLLLLAVLPVRTGK
jgi:hypothetical protein